MQAKQINFESGGEMTFNKGLQLKGRRINIVKKARGKEREERKKAWKYEDRACNII
jgi:hypothetical protein